MAPILPVPAASSDGRDAQSTKRPARARVATSSTFLSCRRPAWILCKRVDEFASLIHFCRCLVIVAGLGYTAVSASRVMHSATVSIGGTSGTGRLGVGFVALPTFVSESCASPQGATARAPVV